MAAANTVTVLGVDTSLRSTGVAVVRQSGSRMQALEFGVLSTSRNDPLSACLVSLRQGIADLVDRHRPDAAVVEGAFFYKNVKTAMILGQARGVVIAACAAAGLPIYEYAPRRVKQAAVGVGSASKEQVRQMVMTMFGLSAAPKDDASDALAIAVCHLHNRSGYRALAPEPI